MKSGASVGDGDLGYLSDELSNYELLEGASDMGNGLLAMDAANNQGPTQEDTFIEASKMSSNSKLTSELQSVLEDRLPEKLD